MAKSMDVAVDGDKSLTNFSFNSPDFISELNSQEVIWNEDSADGIIKQFSELMKLKYQAENFSIYRVFDKSNIVKIANMNQWPSVVDDLEEESKPKAEVSAVVENEIRVRLLSSDNSLFEKVELAVLDGLGDYVFFSLGLHLNNQMIAVWEKPSTGISSEVLGFLAIVQHELAWYRKFDLVQSRLGEDDLTQLQNYRSMNRALDFELKRADRFQYQFSVLFIDLDNFKAINDSFGHAVGSEVLKAIGRLMKALLREVDSVFRYGGDEFVLLLLGADRDSARGVAERVRDEIAAYDFTDIQQGLSLTVSIGVSVYPDDASSKEGLLEIADKAMYLSKNNGKNSVSTTKEILAKEFSDGI